jgi:phosphoribosylformimino-5-aminoimidazole carboxamide ribotide isomerase
LPERNAAVIVYPEISIKEGRLASYRRGQTVLPEMYYVDPIEWARELADGGAEWINVVDLDAGGKQVGRNADLIGAIIDALEIPVQVGGGIAKLDQIDWWIERGAGSVVVGAAAVLNPGLVEKASRRHPWAVVVATDVRGGQVAVEGWTRPSTHEPIEFLGRFDGLELAAVIVNDMDYSQDAAEGSFALVSQIGRVIETPVIASGLVKSRDDLSTLCHLEGISGAILGRALFDGSLSLRDAHAVAWEDQPEIGTNALSDPSGILSGLSFPSAEVHEVANRGACPDGRKNPGGAEIEDLAG